jgi:hypothetical protein
MKNVDSRKRPEAVRNQDPGLGEQAGEAVGGIGGTVAGAALGSLAGPVGSILGGIAGAVGGWWAGEKVGRAAEDMGEHDTFYRSHWEQNRRADLDWDEARIGYGVGHVAGRNPDYAGLPYEDIEPDIRRGWNWKQRDYETMRPYVRTGYERTMSGTTVREYELGSTERIRGKV